MMRQYTVVFMEQRIGVARLRPMEGEQGVASFEAADEEAALAHISAHFLDRMKLCVRAELSSLRIEQDPRAPGGVRWVDDTHANPRFQETYVKYNPVTQAVEADWDSTRTALLTP
jgi:hypothetical protein